MPIPSLTSSLKPRNHIVKVRKRSKSKEDSSTTESCSRLGTADVVLQSSRDPTPSVNAESTLDSSSSSDRPSQPPSNPTQSNVDGAKRRSFLPQRGLPQYNSRTNKLGDIPKEKSEQETVNREDSITSNVPVSQQASMQGSTQARLRPRSMYQTSSGRTEQLAERKIPTRSMRPPDTKSSNTSSGLIRSQSLRRPEASIQSSQVPTARAHTRTQSTNTVTATRKDPLESKIHSERPRSLLIEPSRSTKSASNAGPDNAPSGIRNSVRLAALKRSASTRVKADTVEGVEAIGQAVKADEPSTTSIRRREPLREEPKKQGRPAFSTLQQHFTPRKTSKAPTSTFLHPPAQEVSAGSLSTDIINLQSELLQLHLLHVSAEETNRRWEISAKRGLRGKFDEVASLYQVMRENERQGQEQKNIQALREWNGESSSFALVEHIQLLSGPLHELPSLVDSGGRFERLVDEFERWKSIVVEVRVARENDVNGQGSDLGHVEGLGDAWRAENAALTRKLTTFSRDIDRVTQPASGSSIASMVATCKTLLDGILDELHVMQTIETIVVGREQAWVETRLQAIARGVGHLVDPHEGNEAWRMY